METFHLFVEFPLEVQRKIWKAYTRHTPRIIEIVYVDQLPTSSPVRPIELLTSNTLQHPLLHVSSEARKAALTMLKPLNIDNHFTGVHINWDIDTILFGKEYRLHSHSLWAIPELHKTLIENCRSLALPVDTFFEPEQDGYPGPLMTKCLSLFEEFKCLKHLTLVWNTHRRSRNKTGLLKLATSAPDVARRFDWYELFDWDYNEKDLRDMFNWCKDRLNTIQAGMASIESTVIVDFVRGNEKGMPQKIKDAKTKVTALKVADVNFALK